jgi:hypothetical protein
MSAVNPNASTRAVESEKMSEEKFHWTPSSVYKRWGVNKAYKSNNSLITFMKNENIIDDKFLSMIEMLSIEDLIAIKLESSSRLIGGRLYGIPLIASLTDIIKEAIFKFAISSTSSNREAILFLGVNRKSFYRLKNRFGKKGILDKLKFIEYEEKDE